MKSSNKIGILTYHNVTNNGAVAQAYSLSQALTREFGEYQVKILDYLPKTVRRHEFLKMFKPCKRVPLFYAKRYWLFRKFSEANLTMEKELPRGEDIDRFAAFLNKNQYRALVVGSDNIWRISDGRNSPGFPNIYWLTEQIKGRKIAYAASAYGSKPTLVKNHKDTIQRHLDLFDLIGVRDEFTYSMVKDAGVNTNIPLRIVPDPTFLYTLQETDVRAKLSKERIDLDKPILGILIYGRAELSSAIREHYKSQGYQIVALGMYNPYADVNLGHILDPFEWADAFKYLTFCISDRFHGTIFCLKNKTPFISFEPRVVDSLKESKIYSLLKSIDLTDCYAGREGRDCQADLLLERSAGLLEGWSNYIQRIEDGLERMQRESLEYIREIKRVVTNASNS